MQMPPTAVLAALAALALAAPAAAEDREGFLVGGSFGFNVTTKGCYGCQMVAGPSLIAYAGATVRPGLAVLGEVSMHAYSDGGPESSGYFGLVGGVQYAPIRWFWVGAGGGVSGNPDGGGGRPIVVAQSGIDFRGGRQFGIDLRGRYEWRIEDPNADRSLVFSVGFTWY